MNEAIAHCIMCHKEQANYWPGVCGLPCWRDFCDKYGLDSGEHKDNAFVAIDSELGREVLEKLLNTEPDADRAGEIEGRFLQNIAEL